jgi:hypothetical protein
MEVDNNLKLWEKLKSLEKVAAGRYKASVIIILVCNFTFNFLHVLKEKFDKC